MSIHPSPVPRRAASGRVPSHPTKYAENSQFTPPLMCGRLNHENK